MSAPAIISSGTAAGGPPVGGTGTPDTIPRWTGPSTLGDSGLIDDGSVIYTTARNAAFGSTSSAGYRARVLAAAGAGSAFGLRIDAGTNSTDYALRIANQATTSDYLAVRGDGNVGIGTPSPWAKLAVLGASDAGPTSTDKGIGGFYTSTNVTLSAGGYTASPYGMWLQAHDYRSGVSAQYPLILQPAGGNVGIGTASPTSVAGFTSLTVYNATSGGFVDVSNGGRIARFACLGSGAAQVGTITNHDFAFITNATERARIDSAGNFGIGTASPWSKISAVTANGADTVSVGFSFDSANNYRSGISTNWSSVSASGNLMGFLVSNATPTGFTRVMTLNGVGQAAIGTTSFTSGRALTTVADLDVFGVRVGRGGDASQTSSVAVGPGALGAASTGAQNTAIGNGAMSLGTGASNTAVGSNCLASAFSGSNNTAVGVGAMLPVSSTASGNVALGMEALRSHTSGNSNTALGWRAGYGAASANANTTGSDNIYVGRETVGTANNNTNEIVIGAGATGNGSNTVTIGNSSNVGTFLDTKYVRLVDSYTVGTLPAAGTAGRIARVTDGDAALAWGATVVNTGAGATPYLVWDNGTNWTVFGK
jgi:hypothetical protein